MWDPHLSRLTRLSTSGDFLGSFSLPAVADSRDVVPLGRRLLFARVASGVFWSEIDSTGAILSNGPFPTSSLGQVPRVARQPIVEQRGTTWAAGFPYGDLFVVYQDTSIRCIGRLTGAAPFPATAGPDMRASIVGLVLADSSLYTLAKPRTTGALRVLDEYDATTCDYRRSRKLPGQFTAMSVLFDIFYFTSEELVPHIVALTMK